MEIKPFATEQFFSLYEFNAKFPLSVSDCETLSIQELLDLAGIGLDEFASTRLHYTESQGDPALRGEIAAAYESVGAEDVIYLGAPVEGIYLVMRTLLEPGDEVVVMRPAYDALINMVEHVTGGVVPWDLQPRENWELDFHQLEKIISPQTKMLVVNFPHNPTGFLPNHEQFTQLVEICRANDVWLFCDEMYRGLERNETHRLPSASDVYERAISLSGLSKTYGLPGLRSGWLVVRDSPVRERLINWKHYTTICASGVGEQLARVAMRVREELMRKNCERVQTHLDLAEPFFQRRADLFHFRRPAAGSVALVGVREKLLKGRSPMQFCHELVKNHGIMLLPGECLGTDVIDEEDVAGYVRFGFGRDSFRLSLAALDEVLS